MRLQHHRIRPSQGMLCFTRAHYSRFRNKYKISNSNYSATDSTTCCPKVLIKSNAVEGMSFLKLFWLGEEKEEFWVIKNARKHNSGRFAVVSFCSRISVPLFMFLRRECTWTRLHRWQKWNKSQRAYRQIAAAASAAAMTSATMHTLYYKLFFWCDFAQSTVQWVSSIVFVLCGYFMFKSPFLTVQQCICFSTLTCRRLCHLHAPTNELPPASS